MQMAIARAGLLVVSLGIGYEAGAQSTTTAGQDSTSQTPGAPAPSITPAVAIVTAGLAMPADVRGYRVADSVRLPGANAGTLYTYARPPHDRITVLVSPYDPALPLRTQDDTTGMLQSTVDALRVSLYDAYRSGNLTAFSALGERGDDVKASGHKVRGYVLVAGLTHIGGATLPAAPCHANNSPLAGSGAAPCASFGFNRTFESYVYYAVYALPGRVLRVRADVPLEVAANEQVPDFAHRLVGALTAAH